MQKYISLNDIKDYTNLTIILLHVSHWYLLGHVQICVLVNVLQKKRCCYYYYKTLEQLRANPFAAEFLPFGTSFLPMPDTVSTCNARDKTNLFSTIQHVPFHFQFYLHTETQSGYHTQTVTELKRPLPGCSPSLCAHSYSCSCKICYLRMLKICISCVCICRNMLHIANHISSTCRKKKHVGPLWLGMKHILIGNVLPRMTTSDKLQIIS